MRTLITLILMLVAITPAFAIRFERGENIRISIPVNEDIYVMAGTISTDAIIRGDFFAMGGTVNLNDTITGDLAVAGGTINLRSVILDDVRCAGGTLIISGYVGGDLLITGGTVTIESGAIIAGDVYVAGGTLHLDGTVRGNLKSGSGELILNGSIAKNADLNGGKITLNGSIGGETILVAQELKVEHNASLGGNVRYWTNKGEVDFGNALKNGTATLDVALQHRFEQPKPQFLGFVTFFGVLGYLLAMLLLLAMGEKLFGSFFTRVADTIREAPAQSFGYGFLYFIVVPVVIVLLFITLIGIPVGLIGLFFYILFMLLAHVITALTGAHWLNKKQGFNWNFWKIVGAALGILVLLKVVSMVPLVGWLAVFLAVCIAFGAIWQNSWIQRFFKGKTGATVTP